MKIRSLILILSSSFLFLSAPRVSAAMAVQQKMEIHEYMVRLDEREHSIDSKQLVLLTDISLLNKKMKAEEMAEYIKSSTWQAKMVYRYSKFTKDGDVSNEMTPMEFVHSLADDLFQRKALQHFVNKKQKDGLVLRMEIMEWALQKKSLTEEKLEEIVKEYISLTY